MLQNETANQLTLKAYVDAFVSMNSQNYRQKLAPCFAEKVRFKDPFNDVEGKKKTLAIFEHMYANLIEPKFEVSTYFAIEDKGYIEWKFHFKMSMTDSDKQLIEGMSRVRFDADAKVVEHIDFWDSGEVVFRKIPFLKWFNNAVAKRLAVPFTKV